MSPSVRILFWYFWRLSRWNIAFLPAVCTAAMWLVAFGTGDSPGAPAAYGNILLQVFLIVSIGGVGIMQGLHRAVLPSPYLMTLPMTTGRYLATFYGYLIAVIATVSCLMTAIHFNLFGNVIQGSLTEVTLGFYEIPLLCVCLVCMIQSLLHLSGIRNELLFIPLGIAMILLAFVCALPLLDPGISHGHSITRLSMVALGFAVACSYGSLKAYRCGRYDSAVVALMSALEIGQGRIQVFATPERALFWFGWRRHGRIFLFGTLLFCLLGGVLGVANVFHYDSAGFHAVRNAAAEFLFYMAVPIMLSAACLSTVVSVFRDSADFYQGRGAFLFTLPTRTASLARGRLLAMACSLALVISVATMASLLTFGVANWLSSESGNIGLLFLHYPGVFLLMAPVAWIAIWFSLAALPVYFLLMAMFGVSSLLFGHAPGALLVLIITTVIALAAVGILAAAFYRGIMDRTNVILLAVTSIPTLSVPILVSSENPEGAAVYCVASFLLALPFAAVPLAMDWLRRR